MSPRTFLPMRAVGLALFVSTALFALGATSPLSAAQDDLDAARDRLEGLRSSLESVSERYIEAREGLVRLNEMMDVRFAQVERRARTLIGFEKDAEALAVELYMGGASIGAIEGLLASENLVEMNRTTAYLEFTGEDQQRVIERFVRDSAELERELDLLDEQRARAQTTLEQLQDIQASVESDAARVQQEVEGLEQERAEALAAERAAAEAAAAQATETVANNPPPVSTAPVPSPSSEADWEAIAMCESGGNWHIDSTYDGGLQFHPNTWLGYGGGRYARYAWQATKEQQIAIAEKVLASQGPGAWPHCFQWK